MLTESAASAEEHAWSAHRQEDWPEAHARWVAMRRRFPDSLIAYAADGVALRCMRRFADAEALYADVFARWPGLSEYDLLADYAELANAQSDSMEASRRWARLRERFPDKARGYLRDAENASSAGRPSEAEALLVEAQRRFPEDPVALIEYAHVARRRGWLPEALQRWEAVLKKFPNCLEGYVGAASVLFELRRFAAAQTVLRPALQRFPESAVVLDWHGRIAYARDDLIEAANSWTQFRERFPTQPAGFSGGIQAELALGNFAAAADVGDQARTLFPKDPQVAIQWSSIAERLENWPEAERRWAETSERFPTLIDVTSGHVKALLRNQKYPEAERLTDAALALHGEHLGLLRSHADCATARGDWEVAKARWDRLMVAYPGSPIGLSGLTDMLEKAGRLEESAALLTAGLETYPEDDELQQNLAWNFNLQRDWPRALSLWEHLIRKYPQRASVVGGLQHALRQAQEDLETATEHGAAPAFEIPAGLTALAAQPGLEAAELKQLLMQFESLGDTCEFGMVQAQFGAEPIGLLRFATTTPTQLVAALNNDLLGIGDPEHTVVEAHGGEFVTWDRRYRMYANTFTPDTAEPLAAFTQRQLRRMQYLRRKLLEDLKSGRKIFLYSKVGGLSEGEARAIHAAIRRYNGGATVLCVSLSDAAHAPGCVDAVDSGLFLGYVDRFSTVDINVDVWIQLVKKTRALRDSIPAVQAVS